MNGEEPLILVVDDEPSILRLVEFELSLQGFRVVTATTGEEALRIAAEQEPVLAVVDIMLPGMDGLQTMSKLREQRSLPIILLTARSENRDKVQGLNLGADDYLPKPFSPDELAARIRAVLRSSQSQSANMPSQIVNVGDVEIDLTRRLVMRGGKLVSLSRTEWLLLQELATNADKVLFNQDLINRVWGPGYSDDWQYLRVSISRLRAKLDADRSKGSIIRTHPGVGYRLDTGPVGEPETADAEDEAEAGSKS